MTSESVPDRLQRMADVHRERGKGYGDNYKHSGKRFVGLFPRGITLSTEEDFAWFSLFVLLDSKLSRYAQNREINKTGHADSLDDLAVYAQMLREIDDESSS